MGKKTRNKKTSPSKNNTGSSGTYGSISLGTPFLEADIGKLGEGSITSFISEPAATSEAFIYNFCSENETTYLNIDRPMEEIIQEMNRYGNTDEKTRFIDLYSNYFLNEYGDFETNFDKDERFFEYVTDNLKNIAPNDSDVNIVIDELSFFEQLDISRRRIQGLINQLKKVASDSDGAVIINVSEGSDWLRSMVERKSSTVIWLNVDRDNGSKEIVVPKHSFGETLTEPSKYSVEVDRGPVIETGRKV